MRTNRPCSTCCPFSLMTANLQTDPLATMSFVLEEPTLSTTEAARELGLTSPDYLLRLIRCGVIRAERVGRAYRIERREIELRKARTAGKRSSKNFQQRAEERQARRTATRAKFAPMGVE